MKKRFQIVGKDVEDCREGVDLITENGPVSEDYNDDYFLRVGSFTKKTCFGWLDETDEECIKHCDFQHLCAKKREATFSKIGQKFKEAERDLTSTETMKTMMQDIDSVKDQAIGKDSDSEQDIANKLSNF